jgi:hypothetical protein
VAGPLAVVVEQGVGGAGVAVADHELVDRRGIGGARPGHVDRDAPVRLVRVREVAGAQLQAMLDAPIEGALGDGHILVELT